MKKIFSILTIATSLALTACDDHIDVPERTTKASHVVCESGKVIPYESLNPSDPPIAVVFYVNRGEDIPDEGYAVYLWDISSETLCDSIGVKQGTSADLSGFDGNENTYALYSNKEAPSPLAERVFAMWRYGQSAYIPSVAQMQLLYQSRHIINPMIEKCGGTPLPTEEPNCWYWTSTEVKGQEAAKAWLFSLVSGALQETPKIQSHRARPIITVKNIEY
jgi:hypothetical protein